VKKGVGMKAKQRLAGRSAVATTRPTHARTLHQRANVEDAYGDPADECDFDFVLEDDRIPDEVDSDMTEWCDAQDVMRELAGRARY
jgi:hypothetical protein